MAIKTSHRKKSNVLEHCTLSRKIACWNKILKVTDGNHIAATNSVSLGSPEPLCHGFTFTDGNQNIIAVAEVKENQLAST